MEVLSIQRECSILDQSKMLPLVLSILKLQARELLERTLTKNSVSSPTTYLIIQSLKFLVEIAQKLQ